MIRGHGESVAQTKAAKLTPTIATRSMRLAKPAAISLAYFGAMFQAKLQVSNAVAVFFKQEVE